MDNFYSYRTVENMNGQYIISNPNLEAGVEWDSNYSKLPEVEYFEVFLEFFLCISFPAGLLSPNLHQICRGLLDDDGPGRPRQRFSSQVQEQDHGRCGLRDRPGDRDRWTARPVRAHHTRLQPSLFGGAIIEIIIV